MEPTNYLTVAALTKYIKRKFDADPHLENVFVKGEISNYKRHSSGHMYLTLKDEKSRINAVMFARDNQSLSFEPENGMRVMIKGEVSVYESSGGYQIYIKEMIPDGVGELFIAYEQLKKKLDAEGLFAVQYKKAIPAFPHTIGIITSPTGAAIRDILSTLERRYPIGNVIIFPALVQGKQAGPSIAKAIDQANQNQQIDVLIVGRGGGSIEELWPFNEEMVARAIFGSRIPIISAVGHETDTTISDFVADLRAPTPTGAAELAAPHLYEVSERLKMMEAKISRYTYQRIEYEKSRLTSIRKSYAFRYPDLLYQQKLEQLDRIVESLNKANEVSIVKRREKLESLTKSLVRNNPADRMKRHRDDLNLLSGRLNRVSIAILKQKQQQYVTLLSLLSAVSPLKIMERGYSLVYSDQKELINTIQAVRQGDAITVVVQNGQLDCTVTTIRESESNE